MISKIVFYNFWHFGDIHLSRSLVSETIKLLQDKNLFNFEYSHGNNPNILRDIKNLNFLHHNIPQDKAADSFIDGDVLFFNTWYRTWGFYDRYGMTFDCLYFLFSETIKKFFGIGLDEKDLMKYFPQIDYSFFEIDEINKFSCSYDKMILVCNNEVQSSQSVNFCFDGFICRLAQKYTNCLFVMSNKFFSSMPINVVWFGDLFTVTNPCNLNEISYFANKCRVIIGRSSGPFTFCMTRDKYLDSSKTIISFSNIGGNKYWLGQYMKNKITYGANVIESRDFGEASTFNIISEGIER